MGLSRGFLSSSLQMVIINQYFCGIQKCVLAPKLELGRRMDGWMDGMVVVLIIETVFVMLVFNDLLY